MKAGQNKYYSQVTLVSKLNGAELTAQQLVFFFSMKIMFA